MTPSRPAAVAQPCAQPAPPPSAPAALARRSVLALVLSLVILGLAWELWLAPTGRGTLALKVVPLVLMLPGLVRHRLDSYRALSLLLWLYVLEGLVRATSEAGPGAVLAAAEVVFAVALFAAAAFYIRRRVPDGAAARRGDARP